MSKTEVKAGTFPSKAFAFLSATPEPGPLTAQRRTPRAEDFQVQICIAASVIRICTPRITPGGISRNNNNEQRTFRSSEDDRRLRTQAGRINGQRAVWRCLGTTG